MKHNVNISYSLQICHAFARIYTVYMYVFMFDCSQAIGLFHCWIVKHTAHCWKEHDISQLHSVPTVQFNCSTKHLCLRYMPV